VPLLFVYGSLRRGESNHARMQGARFVGAGRTAPVLALVDHEGFTALVPGGQQSVAGEIYELDAAHLARIDAFEGHPTSYVRTTIALDDGRSVEAYLLPR
jgi:gamma-glutamylaminecyclotransferase